MDFMRDFPDDDLPGMAVAYPLLPGRRNRPLRHLWQDEDVQAVRDGAATPVVDLHHLRNPRPSDRGTIFHKSSTSLHLWFYAMYLMTSTRCGISAKQLEREIGVTYKTAWRMMNLIRNELMFDEGTPLGGTVEMDEAYIGGKRRGSPWPSGTLGRIRLRCSEWLSGAGKIAAYTMPNLTGAEMLSHVENGYCLSR